MRTTLFSLLIIFSTNSMATKTSAPYLYAVTKDGKTSYLLGSMHFGVALSELPKFVTELIKQKKAIVSESSMYEAFKIEYHYGNKNPLPMSIRTALVKRGLPESVVDFAPLEKLCNIYFVWDLIKDQRYKKTSLDAQIQVLGETLGKKFIALDTNQKLLELTEEQLGRCTVPALSQTIIDFPPEKVGDVYASGLAELVKVYFEGDETLLTDNEEVSSVYLRNQYWMTALINAHNEGYFAVVGMTHLAPSHPLGLINLLRTAGFTVTRVTDAPPSDRGSATHRGCLNEKCDNF
jgi:uncharacterized protein YbaP (TraB family)